MEKTPRWQRLLREPLLHFILIGAALFAVHGVISTTESTNSTDEIVISRAQIEILVDGFNRTWHRSPNPDEYEGLVRSRVREEVYYREALALGLDKDDSVIRRRLQQKLEFISNDLTADIEASDAELNQFLQTHAERFATESLISFEQIYFNPGNHAGTLDTLIQRTLEQLNDPQKSLDPADLGDVTMLQRSFDTVRIGEISSMFGTDFATQLEALVAGRWQGPLLSGFGAHLVRVSERLPGRLPALAEVRAEVHLEWMDSRRRDVNELLYQQLLKNYRVTIEQ